MSTYSASELAGSHLTRGISASIASRLRTIEKPEDTPVYMQVITWLLFWPVLTLVARRTVFFGGPPPDALTYKYSFSAPGRDHITIYITMIFLGFFCLIGYQKIWKVLVENPLIPCCLVYAGVSALWSSSLLITLHMSLGIVLCSLFACYLSARLTPERLMSLLILVGLIAAGLSILFALYLPSYGISSEDPRHAWQGICNQKNEFGMSLAFLLTPVFFTDKIRLLTRIGYTLLLLFLIGMSQSRGAWLVTAGMFLFVGWLELYRRLRQRESYLLIAATLILVVAGVVVVLTFLDPLTRLMGKDPTFTGRTDIYAEVFKAILKHPVLGYGFGSFWIPVNPDAARIGLRVNFVNIGYAENGVLELALQLGLLGVGVVLTIIGRALTQAARLIRSPFYNPRVGWYATILVLEFLTNIDAGWLMAADTLDWVLTLIACIGLANEVRRAAQHAAAVA